MAAFEKVTVNIKSLASEETDELDIRTIELPFDPPPFDGFDPLEHNVPVKPIKPWMAYFNLARTGFGTGMLGIPMAISQVGLVVGPIMTVAVGLLVIHTHIVLLWCLNEICRQLKITKISYRYGFRLALLHGPPILHLLGRIGPTIVAIFMIMSQLGVCTVFVILTADSVRDTLDWASINPALLVLYVPYVTIELFMLNIRWVSYTSVLGNILNPVALVLIFVSIIRDPHGECVYYSSTIISYILAFGMILCTMSAVGVTLSIEKNLENPRIMTSRFGVLSVGIMIPTLLSVFFGTIGYWSIGTMDENILRYLPYDEPLSLVIFGVYMVTVTITYPVFAFAGVEVMLDILIYSDHRVTLNPKTVTVIRLLSRPVFVTVTFIIAYLMPFQAPFVAFVGNLCTTILALVFPTLMEIGLLYPHAYGPYKYKLVKDLLIVLTGTILWSYGAYSTMAHIYLRHLVSENKNTFGEKLK